MLLFVVEQGLFRKRRLLSNNRKSHFQDINGVIFTVLKWPLTRISRSRYGNKLPTTMMYLTAYGLLWSSAIAAVCSRGTDRHPASHPCYRDSLGTL